MKKELNITALLAAVTLTLSGCASNPDSTSSLANDAAQSETITHINTLRQSIDAADSQLETGSEQELSWFAEKEVTAAVKALADAKDYYKEFEFDPSKANSSTGFFSSQTNLSAAEDAVSQFNTHMINAQTIRTTALTTLSEAFSYRKQLKAIEAEQYFPSTVAELNKELKKLVDLIADGKTDSAVTAQPTLITKQRTLEIKTVTAIYLTDAKSELDRLIKTDMAQHAPNALSQVSSSLTATTAFIAINPRSIEAIKLKATEVMLFAKRAEHIALAVKSLKALPQSDYEDHVVKQEKIMLAISEALHTEEIRDLSFEEQGARILAFIETNMNDQQVLNKQLDTLRNELLDQTAYSVLLETEIRALKDTATETNTIDTQASNDAEIETTEQ